LSCLRSRTMEERQEGRCPWGEMSVFRATQPESRVFSTADRRILTDMWSVVVCQQQWQCYTAH